ncbi:MAG: nicotinate phosphoribosyltransferase [Anaerolineales bacterium]
MNKNDQQLAEGILFTDQYQLTMAQLYFRMGLHKRKAQFDYFFRSYPDYGNHKAGYCISAGLEWLLDWMGQARFRPADLEYLRSQKGQTGERIFADDFLEWLEVNGNFDGLTLRAIPEGRVIHPNVPIAIVQGPLAMAQILETSLLNHLNYQTLIATKAARIRSGGRGRLLLEFGLRRGPDKGVNAGARAALIGGADFTSNVGISHVLGYPPKGTHAHSMVQIFMTLGQGELDAFRAYAETYPDDCLLLVDTVDTLESGIPNAITIFEELRQKGHEPVGIRLDSGDLAYLSIQAAKMLNDAGFPDVSIVLSNQLDELVIWQILTQLEQEAGKYGVDPDKLIDRLVYGVGTNLITSSGDSSLDGVYKLVAVQDNSRWVPAIKISENPAKIPNPGYKHVWRVYDERGHATADLLGLEDEDPRQEDELTLRHPSDAQSSRKLDAHIISEIEALLEDVIVEGDMVYDLPSIDEMRALRDRDLERLDPGVKRIMYPHIYHVSLTQRLWDLKQDLRKKYHRKSKQE